MLKRALSSVLKQTFSKFVVQVYDNASGDETASIVSEFSKNDERVQYHCHDHNIGMMANYKYGLERVKTPFFSILSDDDLLFPQFYETVLQGFEKHPDIAFSAAIALPISSKGEIFNISLNHWKREGYFTPKEAIEEMIAYYPVPTCVLFNTALCNRISIDMSNQLTWDCDFLIHLALRFPVFITKVPCGIMLQHDTSFSNTRGVEEWDYAMHKMIKRVQNDIEIDPFMKKRVERLIKLDVKRTVQSYFFTYLLNRKFIESRSAIAIYEKNKCSVIKIIIFKFLLFLSNRSSLIIFLLKKLRQLKRSLRARSNKGYNSYAQYLK